MPLSFFDMHGAGRWGGRFIVLSVLAYLINLGVTITRSKKENVHAVFVFTAVAWLFLTAFFGLVLVYNFNSHLLPKDSQHYLTLHAHAGIAGWFLLLVIGVASRLVPMFLISKYTNPRLLWVIYDLINGALVLYLILFFNAISARVEPDTGRSPAGCHGAVYFLRIFSLARTYSP